MAAVAHLRESFVRASREAVWSALTDPDQTGCFARGYRVDTSFPRGGKWRLVADRDDRDVVEGDVETFDAPNRLVVTWRMLSDADLADEPPSRVEWTLVPASDDGTVTLVTLRHTGLALSPLTWERMRLRWPEALDSLKSYLETGSSLPPLETDVVHDPAEIEANWHRAQAVTANNAVWELLDGRSLRPDEIDELLERAYAAAHHWRRASGATVVTRARTSYLLARAHAYCGHGDLALHHAEQCSNLVSGAPDDMADFDHAYGYEARARALACLGRLAEAGEVRRRAAAVRITDAQDRSIFDSDLAAGPWFGLDSDAPADHDPAR